MSDDGGAYVAGMVELYEFPGGLVDDPVPRAAPQNLGDKGLLSAPVEGDVEEAGPGDVDAGHAFRVREVRPQDLGDLPRRTTGGAGQLQGDARGVVPATAGPRGRDLGTLRNGRREFARVHCAAHCTQDGMGELDGGHGTSVGEEGVGRRTGLGEGPGCGRWVGLGRARGWGAGRWTGEGCCAGSSGRRVAVVGSRTWRHVRPRSGAMKWDCIAGSSAGTRHPLRADTSPRPLRRLGARGWVGVPVSGGPRRSPQLPVRPARSVSPEP